MSERKLEELNQKSEIEEIINQEILNYRHSSEETINNLLPAKAILDKIFDAVWKEVTEQNYKLGSFNAFLPLIKQFKIERFIDIGFDRLKKKLNEALLENENNHKVKNTILYDIEIAESKVVNYYETLFLENHSSYDEIQKLVKIKKELSLTKESEQDYRRKALLNLEKKILININLLKEEKTLRDQSEESFNATKDNKNKHDELNKEIVTLFMNHFFDYANVKCSNAKKAEVIAFLTGYSSKQIVKLFSELEKERLKIEENEEVSEKIYKDLNVARKLFVKLNLTEIIEKIDKELGN